MGKFYWLKLKKDFFKRHDIRIIEGMQDGGKMVLFYLKLLCESVDHDGALRFSAEVPYDNDMLSSVTNTDKEVVDEAMKILKKLGMVKVEDDGTIIMNGVDSMLGSETAWAEKKKKQRMLPPLSNGSKRINGEMMLLPNGKNIFVDEKRYGGNGMLVMDRACGKCEICGSENNVLIHHNNGYSNDPDDLICLCSKCHGIAHNKEHGGHIDINVHHVSTMCPPYVPQMSDKRKSKSIEIEKEIEIDNSSSSYSSVIGQGDSEEWKPKKDDVFTYALENHLTCVSVFWDYYQARNWMIKDAPIRDWRSLLQVWEKNSKGKAKANVSIMENEYTKEHIRQKEIESLKDLDDLLAD